MNWDANLAAIIKHTDANLQHHFRQFDDRSLDPPPAFAPPPAFSGSGRSVQPSSDTDHSSFAHAFLRDTTATLRGTTSAPPPPTSFAQHFRDRQKRASSRSDDDSDTGDGATEQPQYEPTSRRHRRSNNATSGSSTTPLMFASPTYDMAQMMEQVRLSLKLEVDARAALAERQLSALLQLCKASSEELDRVRIDVCAADRQLHTLDQTNAKLRQDLTTQKDICFHLQSMCGKDEAWRMQAENQLLEMRQLVAAIREQGNAVQLQVQDKLSRQELLVHFNAAIEPIKAQFQATLQHQAHQLAEITRTSSSSSLVLDALVQKLNRVQADEIVALRTDLQALKIHVSRMGTIDVSRGTGDDDEEEDENDDQPRKPVRRATQRTRAKEAQERERQDAERELQQKQRDELLKKEVVGVIVPNAIVPLLMKEFDQRVQPQLVDMKASWEKDVAPLKLEMQSLARSVQDNWTASQRQATSLETTLNQTDQQLRTDITAQLRELRDKQEQHGAQMTQQHTSLVDTRVAPLQTKHNEVVKAMEIEQKDRKGAIDALHEELRRVRHAYEEQIHTMSCEQRTKATAWHDEWTQKLRDVERKWTEVVETTAKQTVLQVDAAWSKAKGETDARLDRLEGSVKTTTELVDKVEKAVACVAQEAMVLAVKLRAVETEENDLPKITRRGSATMAPPANDATQGQLAAMDSLLQKMMLQMQMQMQQQQQLAMAVPPQYSSPPYWPAPVHPSASSQPLPLAPSATPSVTVVPPPAPVSVPDPVPAPRQETIKAVDAEAKKSPSITRNEANLPKTVEIPVKAVDTNVKTVELPRKTVELPPKATEPPRKSPELPPKTVGLPPDPQLDEIISRAVAEELASPRKPLADATVVASTTPPAVAPTPSEVCSPALTTPAPASSTASPPPSQPTETMDPAAKAQQTLASTEKGATTEVEMAKQRIEARRKQDQETQQQAATTPSGMPPTLARASSASSLAAADTTKTPETTPAAPSPLARSHSVNQLPLSPAPIPSTAAPPPPKPPMTPTSISIPASNPPPAPPVSTTPRSAPSAARPPVTEAKPPTTPELNPPTTKAPSSSPPTASPQSVTHVLCDQCRLPVRSDLLTEHMQRQCIKRTIACTKCTTKFPWHEVETHQRSCPGTTPIPPPPTRAPTPPTVTAPVPPAASVQLDPGPDTANAAGTLLKKCRHCGADVPSSDLFDHELKCDQMLKQCPHCLRRQKVSDLQDHIENCDCRLVSCPNDCGGKFLQRGLDKHLTTRCPKRSSNPSTSPAASAVPTLSSASSGPVTAPPPPPSTPKSVSAPAAPAKTDEAKTGKVECKFCDEEFSSRDIDAHENSCDWKPKRCQHCNMVIISRDLARHEASCKTSTKNCPHCNETMAPSALPTHTSRCSKRPIKCIRCCQLFPADSIVAHSSTCKFIPSAASAVPATVATPAASNSTPVKIPPPPPYPPTASAASVMTKPSVSAADGSAADRMARRNLALSQLTNQPMASPLATTTAAAVPATVRVPAPVLSRPEVKEPDHAIDEEDEDEEDDEDEEAEDDDDEGQLTLAQVVAEWSVENVCLWLHEDVGVPDVVPRFQQRRCNGEMLLELTESDLINDYGIKNRIHRERILSAIDAIKTSDDFSDEEEEDDEEEEEVEEEEEEEIQAPQPRASVSRLALSDASMPRDLLRRNSLPSPQPSPARIAGTPLSNASALPSSSAMLRRINSALNVEFPSTTSRSNK